MTKKITGEDKRKKGAKPQVMDFTNVKTPPRHKDGTPKSMSPKQIRARARRHAKMSEIEFEALYKPLDEWDEEELARGRPRDKSGGFRGASPRWITRQLHEEAMARFKGVVEAQMRGETVTALRVIHMILEDGEVDEKGRPLTPAGTKLDAAKFLLEHLVGKPTQRQEIDVSVRLQALLAVATAGPMADGAENLALPGDGAYEAAFGVDDDEIVEAEDG